jgi:crotonobetainyl-CoA:carnitine CoA-transferase CaiB-like acyl-CoA transferase
LGEHNEDVLRNVLGLSETEIEELYRDKTIVRDPVLYGER